MVIDQHWWLNRFFSSFRSLVSNFRPTIRDVVRSCSQKICYRNCLVTIKLSFPPSQAIHCIYSVEILPIDNVRSIDFCREVLLDANKFELINPITGDQSLYYRSILFGLSIFYEKSDQRQTNLRQRQVGCLFSSCEFWTLSILSDQLHVVIATTNRYCLSDQFLQGHEVCVANKMASRHQKLLVCIDRHCLRFLKLFRRQSFSRGQTHWRTHGRNPRRYGGILKQLLTDGNDSSLQSFDSLMDSVTGFHANFLAVSTLRPLYVWESMSATSRTPFDGHVGSNKQ